MKKNLETICVQGGWKPKNGEPRVLPIFQSTTFKYSSTEEMADLFDLKAEGHFYTRLANPTNDAVAAKINELEGLTDTPSMDPPSTESLIGSEITFGNYAGEDIVWIVLDETENGLFLLSKYAIETKDYNDKNENTTWEKSSLRKWLNGDFYESAFNLDEKKSIKLSYIQNSDNSESGADGGKDTEDRVFLLSIDEAERFFKTDEERIVSPFQSSL